MYPFNPPIRCRFLRIVPWGWRSHISMRVEAFGCYTGKNNSVLLENAWVQWWGHSPPQPPPPPPVGLRFVNPVGETTCGSPRGFFFWVARFFPSFLENNVLNFQSYLGRYRQGDSFWICVLQIYLFICLFFILHNRRFGRLSGIKSHRKKYISMIGRVVSVRKCFRKDKIKQESSNRYKALISFAELFP